MAKVTKIAGIRAKLEKMESIVPEMGREGVLLSPKSMLGTSLAVFTSGGDSQG